MWGRREEPESSGGLTNSVPADIDEPAAIGRECEHRVVEPDHGRSVGEIGTLGQLDNSANRRLRKGFFVWTAREDEELIKTYISTP